MFVKRKYHGAPGLSGVAYLKWSAGWEKGNADDAIVPDNGVCDKPPDAQSWANREKRSEQFVGARM